MRADAEGTFGGLIVSVVAVAGLSLATLCAQARSKSPAPGTQIVACRVLEAHTSPQLGLTVVVFHHRDKKERVRLGTLLRQHSGGTVEMQTAEGSWHSATVLRLKSCFGRGLLLLPVSTVQLAERDEFLLKFPPG